MYSNSYCSYKFAPKQEKIGQSSHKEYSNNILKYLEFTAIINACTKKVWKLIECTSISFKLFFFLSRSFSAPPFCFFHFFYHYLKFREALKMDGKQLYCIRDISSPATLHYVIVRQIRERSYHWRFIYYFTSGHDSHKSQ